eukprot:COSAG05_NODE_358_length_10812_cov_90.986372_11_plen_193_part_00
MGVGVFDIRVCDCARTRGLCGSRGRCRPHPEAGAAGRRSPSPPAAQRGLSDDTYRAQNRPRRLYTIATETERENVRRECEERGGGGGVFVCARDNAVHSRADLHRRQRRVLQAEVAPEVRRQPYHHGVSSDPEVVNPGVPNVAQFFLPQQLFSCLCSPNRTSSPPHANIHARVVRFFILEACTCATTTVEER